MKKEEQQNQPATRKTPGKQHGCGMKILCALAVVVVVGAGVFFSLPLIVSAVVSNLGLGDVVAWTELRIGLGGARVTDITFATRENEPDLAVGSVEAQWQLSSLIFKRRVEQVEIENVRLAVVERDGKPDVPLAAWLSAWSKTRPQKPPKKNAAQKPWYIATVRANGGIMGTNAPVAGTFSFEARSGVTNNTLFINTSFSAVDLNLRLTNGVSVEAGAVALRVAGGIPLPRGVADIAAADAKGELVFHNVGVAMENFDGALEGGEIHLPFTLAQGRFVVEKPSVTWKHFAALGLTPALKYLDCRVEDGVLHAKAVAGVDGSALDVTAMAEVPLAAPKNLGVTLALPDTEIKTGDALVAFAQTKAPQLTALKATLGGEARFELMRGRPVASATARVSGVDATFDKWSVENLRVDELQVEFRRNRLWTPGAPVVRFDTVRNTDGFKAGPAEAQGRWNGREGFLEHASLAWGGGALRTYALRVNPEDLDIDARLYIERVDIGAALSLFPSFEAEGSGTVYGQVAARYAKKRVKIGETFLYSLPGEGGELKFKNAEKLAALLAQTGAAPGVKEKDLVQTLRHLLVSLFRIDLDASNPKQSKLTFRLDGKPPNPALRGINFTVNFNAPLQGLVNLGLVGLNPN